MCLVSIIKCYKMMMKIGHVIFEIVVIVYFIKIVNSASCCLVRVKIFCVCVFFGAITDIIITCFEGLKHRTR